MKTTVDIHRSKRAEQCERARPNAGNTGSGVLGWCVKRLGLYIVLVLLAALAPIPVAAAPTETFVVASNGDEDDTNPGNGICETEPGNGVCTLRAAIEEANAYTGANVINMPAMAITVGAPLTVTQTVVINGAGQSSTIVDGNNATQVFNIAANSGSTIISNLTIQHGNFGGNGGGIYNAGNLTLNNIAVSGSTAAQGGGIYNEMATGASVPILTLNSVTIAGNVATSTALGTGGGGLHNGGSLSGQNVTITNNTGTQGAGFKNTTKYNATLTNFTISNNTSKSGGGINNDLGLLTLNRGTISSNVANCCHPNQHFTAGAGIYNSQGIVALTDVILSWNVATSAGGYGGAIYNWNVVTMNRVSVYGNRAAFGAGLYNGNFENHPSAMTLIDVTVSANVGTSPDRSTGGGGLYNLSGQISLVNSTVAMNSADSGGGILNMNTGSVSLLNTILGLNGSTQGAPNCSGTLTSNGYNLYGHPLDGTCFSAHGAGDITAHPQLGPLQDNGGYTPTHSLLFGSPAIDAANSNGCPGIDQRGVARPQGAGCDIGAYEYAPLKFYLPAIIEAAG